MMSHNAKNLRRGAQQSPKMREDALSEARNVQGLSASADIPLNKRGALSDARTLQARRISAENKRGSSR